MTAGMKIIQLRSLMLPPLYSHYTKHCPNPTLPSASHGDSTIEEPIRAPGRRRHSGDGRRRLYVWINKQKLKAVQNSVYSLLILWHTGVKVLLLLTLVKKGSRSTPHARGQNNRHTKSFGGGSFRNEEGDDDNDEDDEEEEGGLERVPKLVYIILLLFIMFVLLCMCLFLPIRHR